MVKDKRTGGGMVKRGEGHGDIRSKEEKFIAATNPFIFQPFRSHDI